MSLELTITTTISFNIAKKPLIQTANNSITKKKTFSKFSFEILTKAYNFNG